MQEKDKEIMTITDADLIAIDREEEDSLEYRKRKHDDWLDNYILYRDKVITNRLTQRQTVNIPLMRYVLNTQLKEIVGEAQLYFNNVSNDEQKELYYNEYWKEVSKRNSLSIKDYVDKKTNAIFGRSFKKISVVNGKIVISMRDPQDMLVHRFVDPTDIDTAPSLIETGIYVPLREILENEEYDPEERNKLKVYFSTEQGLLESDENTIRMSEKNRRLKTLGDTQVDDPKLGETYIELHEVYRYESSEEYKKPVIFRYVIACAGEMKFKLHKQELCNVIGKTADDFWHDHFPYTSWAGDPEATDFWSDGVADTIRPLNNVLNVWMSQLVENRTLQNFGMKYYDSSNKQFVPQTYTPQYFGWYPVPGNPNEVIKDVSVGNLSGTLEEMQFLIGIAEKASASAGTNSGAVESRKVTLGEVEYALANAQKRIMVQETFYTEDAEDLGLKYSKFIEALGSDLAPLTVYKKGRNGKGTYTKEINHDMMFDTNGYVVEVKILKDKQEEDLDDLQKLEMLKNEMPNNVPLMKIRRRKMMEISGLNPDEVAQVEEFENQQVPVSPEQGAMMNAEGGAQPQSVEVPSVENMMAR